MVSKYMMVIFFAFSMSGCMKTESNTCIRLIDNAKNSSNIVILKHWFVELSNDPKRMKALGFAHGAIQNKGIKNIGLDLSVFDIPEGLVTLDFYSEEKISYKNFEPELVNSLAIGYGMREILFLKVNESNTFGLDDIESFRRHITVISNDVIKNNEIIRK